MGPLLCPYRPFLRSDRPLDELHAVAAAARVVGQKPQQVQGIRLLPLLIQDTPDATRSGPGNPSVIQAFTPVWWAEAWM
jgi:hypothetical protein